MREYITKLNDRNLQRKKATGITNYVLYSLIVIIIFKIIGLIGIIDFKNFEFYHLVKIIWLSFCISLALFWIYQSFTSSFDNSSSIRILKVSKQNETFFIKINLASIFLSTLIPAIIIFHEDYNSGNLDYSFQELILFFLSAMNILFLTVSLSKDENLYKAINNNSNHIILLKIVFVISLSVVIISINLISNIDIPNKSNLILLCILIFSILPISEKIIESYKEDIFSKDLENLEYEIYLKDLSDDDIRDILQKKYMGFLITDWIKLKKTEISNEFENYEKENLEIISQEKDIEIIDKEKYPIEYNGRKEKVKKLKINLESKKNRFLDRNINEINEILKKDPSIKPEDFDDLKSLIFKLSTNKK